MCKCFGGNLRIFLKNEVRVGSNWSNMLDGGDGANGVDGLMGLMGLMAN